MSVVAEKHEKIVSLYKDGDSLEQVASKTGYSQSVIKKIIRGRGIKIREKTHNRSVKVIGKNSEVHVFNSITECANYFKISPSTVYQNVLYKVKSSHFDSAEYFHG